MQALVSFVEDDKNQLRFTSFVPNSYTLLFLLIMCCSSRSIVAGDHKFVFLVKGHLILVAISYAKESSAQVTKT